MTQDESLFQRLEVRWLAELRCIDRSQEHVRDPQQGFVTPSPVVDVEPPVQALCPQGDEVTEVPLVLTDRAG